MPSTLAPPVEHVIFDFDGTLADTFDHVFDLYNRTAAWLRLRRVSRDEVGHLRTLRPVETMRALSVPVWKVPILAWSVRRGLRARMREMSPFPGIDAALSGLRARGVRCSVLSTNSRDNIERFVTHHGLAYFHALAGGSSVFGKAGHLRRFLAEHGLDASRTVYVGDEVRDIEAARAVGLRCVSVTWGFSHRDALVAASPDLVVDSPEALLAALTDNA